MKIAAISDLHIMPRCPASDFYWDDAALSIYLQELLLKVDIVLIVGDFLELWQTAGYSRSDKYREVKEIEEEFPRTMELIKNSDNIELLYGNHDELLSTGISLHARDIITLDEGKVVAFHGIYDYFNNNFPKAVELMSWVAGWLERIVSPFVEADFDKVLRRLLGIKSLCENYKQVRGMKALINRDDRIVVVFNGHSHQPQIVKFIYEDKERIFINCGYFDGKVITTTYLDTETMSIIQMHRGSTVDYSTFRKALEPGDVILTMDKSSMLSGIMSNVTDGKYSHSIAYIGNGRIIDSAIGSERNGIAIDVLDKYLEGNHSLVILKAYDKTRAKRFIGALHNEIGSKYPIWQRVIDLIYYRIKGISGKDLRKAYIYVVDKRMEDCSKLIAKCASQAYNTPIRYPTFSPQDILNTTSIWYKYYELEV